MMRRAGELLREDPSAEGRSGWGPFEQYDFEAGDLAVAEDVAILAMDGLGQGGRAALPPGDGFVTRHLHGEHIELEVGKRSLPAGTESGDHVPLAYGGRVHIAEWLDVHSVVGEETEDVLGRLGTTSHRGEVSVDDLGWIHGSSSIRRRWYVATMLDDEVRTGIARLLEALRQRPAELPLAEIVAVGDLPVDVAIDRDGPSAVVYVTPRPDRRLGALSAREREVATLVVAGFRNQHIAEALFISLATVKDHVHSILHKTGFRSRAELIAAWFGNAG
jgi:DNA-binding CsgD family transcriptional regulator